MNFLKVFYNSFFRTLGRIIVYILLGFLLSVFLSKIDVHADMVSPNEISFNGTNYDSYYEIPVILDQHSLDLRVEIFDLISRVPTLQTNLILDLCATSNQFNIWRTSSAGSSCSTSCFSQLVQVKQIPDLVCRTYTYNDNKAYRIVIPINKWSVGVGDSDYISFDDKITFYNSSVHDLYASIYGAYYSDIGFDLNNQEALFNDLNQTQQNILNKQNEIINSQNNNTDKVIDNQNQNTDKTIENQNENTDKQIDSQKVCEYIDKNKVIKKGYYLSSNGSEATTSTAWGITDYISVVGADLTLVNKLDYSDTYMCFYNSNKKLISCKRLVDLSSNSKIDIPINSSYFRSTISISSNLPTFNLCQNGNQAISGGLNDINGSINNDNVDDPSSSINSFKDKIASNGVITQLIGLPVTLFTKVLNSVNGTCSTYNLGSLFGTDLILPCVNIQNYLGTTLWSVIDVLISGLFVYSISRKFLKVFESMSSMNEGDVIGD